MSRVLQLVTRDEPGGVQILAGMVGEGLQARGHHVRTLALADGIPAILREIVTGGCDAILSYQVAASLLGSLIGFMARIPLRVTHLTAVPHAMRPHWRSLDRQFGRFGLHTRIIANSVATEQAVADYPARYRDRVRLIPHGVPPLPKGPPIWRDRLGLPPDTPLLVASGRLVEQKDHATAIAALPGTEAHLAIAGAGPLHAALLQQAEALGVTPRLHLLGNLDRDQLGTLLAEADIYLFPSVWESFGLGCVEAATAGVPVIAADLPVLREVLAPATEFGMAAFHAAGDATALAQAIRHLLDNRPSRRVQSSAAMQATHGISRMLDAYCRLLDGTSRPSA